MNAVPANNTIVTDKNFVVILTVETAKSAKEFEYHDGRDHVLYILEGEHCLRSRRNTEGRA